MFAFENPSGFYYHVTYNPYGGLAVLHADSIAKPHDGAESFIHGVSEIK